ncbi:hypothetical protein L1049_015508 [Liquidambar formosana]|uniref:Transposase n=1 Tax=Liquidambar formosana TaxID=63359 RepID=A0AAP0RY66_LIQFO
MVVASKVSGIYIRSRCLISQNSKKRKKRAKKNNLGAAAAAIQQGNEYIRISDEGSNSPRPSRTNVEASQQSSAPIDDAEKQRKKRGKNKLHSIPLSGCERLEVEFNERGQPVGENSAKYASHLGSLASKIFVDECHKTLTLRMMGCYWRQFKSEVTSQIVTAAKRNGFKRRLSPIKPTNIKSDREWDALVRYRISPQFQKKKMEEYTQSATAESGNDSIRRDVVAHVLGLKRGGSVRGLRFGSTLTRVDAQLQSNVKVKRFELQLQKQDEEMKKQGDQMKNILLQFEEMKAMFLGEPKHVEL